MTIGELIKELQKLAEEFGEYLPIIDQDYYLKCEPYYTKIYNNEAKSLIEVGICLNTYCKPIPGVNYV